jgi:xanthine dehydrogenase accessory factor
VLVKSAGEMASAIAWRLHMANMRRICMLDLESPLCVRRRVSYCTALLTGVTAVEGIEARAARDRCGRRRLARRPSRSCDTAGARTPSPDV